MTAIFVARANIILWMFCTYIFGITTSFIDVLLFLISKGKKSDAFQDGIEQFILLQKDIWQLMNEAE